VTRRRRDRLGSSLSRLAQPSRLMPRRAETAPIEMAWPPSERRGSIITFVGSSQADARLWLSQLCAWPAALRRQACCTTRADNSLSGARTAFQRGIE
jgi:hypothetical protein